MRSLPPLFAALLLCLTGRAQAEGALSPEVQLCLLHLREAERERAKKVLGPPDELPLYRLELEVDPSARKVTGRAQVMKTAQGRPLEHLLLRVTPNALGRRVKLFNATVNGQAAVLEQPEPTLYRVKLDPAVPPGAAAVVEVRLEATVPRAPPHSEGLMSGLGQTSGPRDYGAFSASERAVILTGILPQIPPQDASGQPWEGPSGLGDLALYEPSLVLASVTVPTGWTAISSGTALGEVPQKDGDRVRFSFAAGLVRDFPLVVGRGYQAKRAEVNGVEVESWFFGGNDAAGARALDYAQASVRELEKRLGPLPWGTLRVVEAPISGGAGGMEFSGLVLISSGLYGAAKDPAAGLGLPPGFGALLGGADGRIGKLLEETLELTVAHEVAHQFFSELVGSDPVSEPVVDEALAQYAALLYFEWRHGKRAALAVREQHLAGAFQMYRLNGGADGAAARPTSEFAGSMEYGALVYGKAPLFFEAARRAMGDEAFFKALRAYVDQYRYRWSCQTCFVDVAARLRPEKAAALRRLRQRWWEQAHGDEDLGRAELGKMVEQLTGQKLDPESRALLEQLLPQLLGQ